MYFPVPPDDTIMCKPVFTKAFKNMEVRDGESLTLECAVNGDPEPQIFWSKNGKAISSSEIMDLKYKNGIAKLTINEIFPEDEGLYVCTATNSIGSTNTQCQLSVIREYYYLCFLRSSFLSNIISIVCSLSIPSNGKWPPQAKN